MKKCEVKRISNSPFVLLLNPKVVRAFCFVLLTISWNTIFGQENTTGLRYFMQDAVPSVNAIPYGANKEAGRYVDVGDAKIYYEVYGTGDPIVVLHGGIVGSPLEMGQFIDSLSRRYQVIAVSTRGHGKSELGSETSTYERKAQDVEAVVNAVTTGSVTVLGFSDGAYTGYFLASAKMATLRN